MQPKKQRIEVEDGIVELDAQEVISYYFGKSQTPVHPEFTHQNFGIEGKILCPKELLPLKINVHVDTYGDLACTVDLTHGGSQSGPLAENFRSEILAKMAKPCDLSDGCLPAEYPGNFGPMTETETCEPAAQVALADGFRVAHYKSNQFSGKSFNTWRRAEWLMLWFIESVSRSQHETDHNWEYYFLRSPENELVAYCSVYKFPSFAFLSKGFIGDRIRLSQFLTLPSGWRNGFGSVLLRHLVDEIRERSDVDKLTMEDPSFGMNSARETVYLKIAKENELLNAETTLEDLEETLKIPRIFAKRIKILLELGKFMSDRNPSSLIDEALASDNKFVRKFIDSIEFYDDSDETEEEQKPIDKEATESLTRDRLSQAFTKLQRVGA
jgi:hypothetical protein